MGDLSLFEAFENESKEPESKASTPSLENPVLEIHKCDNCGRPLNPKEGRGQACPARACYEHLCTQCLSSHRHAGIW